MRFAVIRDFQAISSRFSRTMAFGIFYNLLGLPVGRHFDATCNALKTCVRSDNGAVLA